MGGRQRRPGVGSPLVRLGWRLGVMAGPVIGHIAYVNYVPYQAGHNSSSIYNAPWVIWKAWTNLTG